MQNIREMVEHVAIALVDHPEEVRVQEMRVSNSNLVILNLEVAPQEMGMVIGKKGRLANAIRTILTAAGWKNGQRFQRFMLEISERQ